MKKLFLGVTLLVFAMTMQRMQAQTFRVLYEFNGGSAGGVLDGSRSHGGLIRDTAGNFYGTIFEGGGVDEGVVYKIDSGINRASASDERLLRQLEMKKVRVIGQLPGLRPE